MLVSTMRGNIGQAKDYLLKELVSDSDKLKAEGMGSIAVIQQQ